MIKFIKESVTGVALIFALVTTPTLIAHADEGIVIEDVKTKDISGDLTRLFEVNQTVQIESENEKNYTVILEERKYKIDKSNILKTVKHKEASLTVIKEGNTLKTSPDMFGTILFSLNEAKLFIG